MLKDNTPKGGEENFLTLNAPKQCPLVHLAKVYLRQGKALGSEKD